MNKYEEVINSTSKMIYMIINKYFRGYDKEDLYQVGVLGVIKAYDNYKKDHNTKFSTYAYTYIYGEIYTYTNNLKGLKLARENYSLYKKINEAKNILSQRLMKEPTIYELSSFLELDYKLIENIINSMKNIDSLERTISSDSKDLSLFDTISDEKDYYNIDYIMLNEEINNLPEPWNQIIKLRYFEDKTQSEVASILGMNQVEISRGEAKVLKRIRETHQNVA
ncbi:MAG: sigma-70 family RNA polymerase sigma factor [Bacilli bacterium]